jgi:hypothetical protein
MGNSCSSGQAHKDKDNMSQRSEDYQVRASLPTEKQQTLLNHITPHSGVILEPSTAGQPPLQTPTAPPTAAPLTLSVSERKSNISRVLKGVAASSLSGKPKC